MNKDQPVLPAHVISSESQDKEKEEANRSLYLCKGSQYSQKMLLYYAGTNGDMKHLLRAMELETPLFEECSAEGYFWTCLHYACFYGHMEVIEFIVNQNKEDEGYLARVNLQCHLGKTALMHGLTREFDKDFMKQLLKLFYSNDAIDFSICCHDDLNVFQYAKRAGLGEYFEHLIEESNKEIK